MSTPTYPPATCLEITPAAIAACAMDLVLLRADNPAAHLPASAFELLTMESGGWEWDFQTGRYRPAETILYLPTAAGLAALNK